MQPRTIPALLYERYRKTPDGIAHYTLDADNKWQPHTWQEYYTDVVRLAAGLMEAGLEAGQNIGIMAPASRQWDVVQMAVLFCGSAVVGLDPHDAEENISTIADRSNLHGLVVEDASMLEKLHESLRRKLQFIISLNSDNDFSGQPENILLLKDLLHKKELDIETHLSNVEENNPATIIFTSGTTGTPKGIEYTHKQAVIACSSILEAFTDITEGSRLVCWLPLSNLYQRIINYSAVIVGAATYYVEDPRKVMDYLPEINPHIFLGVPRFYEKLHSGIMENINNKPPIIRKLAHWALQTGGAYKDQLQQNKPVGILKKISYRLADRMILKQLKAIMGSNLKYMISGSAPMPKWLLEELHAMGFLILEAYGISENIIPIGVNRPQSFKFGTVGKPLPGNEIKLADDNELLVQGPGVFSGYYNDPAAENPIDGEGFLATGDYAQVDRDGFLTLTGRKSEIFKTSTGRRISPVKIEALISSLPYVEHAVIFGANRPFLVALLALDPDQLRVHAGQHNIRTAAGADSIPAEYFNFIKKDVLQQVAPLQGYMHPGGLLLTGEPFSIKNGELTANLKIRRNHIGATYKEQLDDIYREAARKKPATLGSSGPAREFIIHTL